MSADPDRVPWVGRWAFRYHSHGVSWTPSPQSHLPEGSLLAGNLLLPSRDQVVEGDTSDAGSDGLDPLVPLLGAGS